MCAPSFTRGLVDPVIDPACTYVTVLVILIILVTIIVLIDVGGACNEVLEYCEDLVIIVELPLDSLGRPRLVGFKCSHEPCMKACWLSEQW